jgi:transcription-repair coupling factor (superfamily II helicase)
MARSDAAPDAWRRSASRLLEQGIGWADLPGDALAWVVAGVFEDRGALLVVDEPDAAERLARGLRFFLADPKRVEVFPCDDVKPYDGFSPSPELPALRARVLHRVGRGEPVLVVAPARALLQQIPNAEARRRSTLELRPGQQLDRDALIAELSATGYLAAPEAVHAGCFAVRGDVLDVWPVTTPEPRRVDFFDDEIEALRQVDPATGRTLRKLQRVVILPAREERLDAQTIARCQEELGRFVSDPVGLAARRRVLEELRAGIRFSGLEDLLPALVPTEAPLVALGALPRIVVHPGSVAASAREAFATAVRRWGDLDVEERPIVPPQHRLVAVEALLEELERSHPVYEMSGTERARSLGFEAVGGLAVRGADLAPTVGRLEKLREDGLRVALVARDARAGEMIEQLLEPHGAFLIGRTRVEDLKADELSLLVGDLPRGFISKSAGLALIPASALFGQRDTEATRRAHAMFESGVTTLSDLKEGDAVVHRLHGVGRYRGLLRLDVPGGGRQDFVRLEYRDGDLLYLPATSVGDLSRFSPSNAGVDVRLDRLGGQTWAKRKGEVRDALLEKAQELLALQARRQLALREAHPEPGPLYKAFEARFPFTETHDQARAILDVHDDLSQESPMDRLVCGDVGFGKTEVAMRAAMRVVEGGHQVAVLCPTTVLAFQHMMTFRERFAGLPVRVEMLSRLSSPSEARETIAGLREGRVDIVVGTHKLLGREVGFQRLGLLVIDEEHRFGVSQKEKFKKLRTEVDVLVMSATPIPRTLQLALSGARDMSIMATPPEERLEVRTTVARLTRTRVRDAILLELSRGGQVYFVHNRVESLEATAARLREWVPEARVQTAHGQMDAEAIERILVDFMQKRFDVLCCTAIVESGVDLPNVNTMLIDRADLYGLGQLHQLRGRVGRSNVRGSCILLTPEEMSRDARRRVQVLVENTRLGSGFAIAAADLEQRGGGNLLGASQSGHIDEVGFDVWVELLEEAVHAARGQVDRERIDPQVELPVAAFIPEALIPDVSERIGWYRRLSEAPSVRALEAVLSELESELRELPPEVTALAGVVELRLLCRQLGVVRLSMLKVRAVAELHPSSPLTDALLARLVAEHPKRMSVQSGPPRVLAVKCTPQEADKPLRFLRWVLARLEGVVRG